MYRIVSIYIDANLCQLIWRLEMKRNLMAKQETHITAAWFRVQGQNVSFNLVMMTLIDY